VFNVFLEGDDPTDVISSINFAHSNVMVGTIPDEPRLENIKLFIGSVVLETSEPVAAIENISNLRPDYILVQIPSLNITGDIGSASDGGEWQVGKVDRLRAEGNWYADVRVRNDTVATLTEPFQTLEVVGSWVDGSYINQEHRIFSIDIGGHLGSSDPADPVEIWSDGAEGVGGPDIWFLNAGSIGEALIGSNRSGLPYLSKVQEVDCAGDFVVAGHPSVPPNRMQILELLNVGGDFDAVLESSGRIPSAQTWRIGASLGPNASISLPANGLEGTIIINDNEVGGRWSETATVNVGSEVLAAPDYTQTASLLGGGAVIVRSEFLPDASMPASGDVVPPTLGGTPYTIELVFSGNVSYADDGLDETSPVTLSRDQQCEAMGQLTLTTVNPSCYSVAPSDPDGDGRFDSIIVTFDKSDLLNGYEYRINPVPSADPGFISSEQIVQADITGTPPVADTIYTIAIGTACFEDIDGDGTIGTADLIALLAAWGTTSLDSCSFGADTDGDGVVGTADLLALLTEWGIPCDPCAPPQAMAATDHTPALPGETPMLGQLAAHFGFASAAEYVAYLLTLDPAQVAEHIVDIIDFVLE
jgi:hypothetical protein